MPMPEDLTKNAQDVLQAILGYMLVAKHLDYKKGWFDVKPEYLTEYLPTMDKETIESALEELQAKGYIKAD